MRYFILLFIFSFATIANAQNIPVLKNMKKKSAHVLKVKIVESPINVKTAGPVLVEVVEVYKSSSMKVGDKFAIYMQPFLIVSDSGKINHLLPGNELVVFLAKGKPNSYSINGKQFALTHLYDDYSGWMFFNENLGEALRKKK